MKNHRSFVLYILIPLIVLLVILGIWAVLTYFPKEASEITQPEDLVYGNVLYVIDGDTLDFSGEDGSEIRVRLIGIDAPESANHDESKNTEEGKTATEFAKRELEGKKVGLEFDKEKEDKYGRTLAYVWIDGKLFNLRMVEEGYAVPLTIEPNEKYSSYIENGYKTGR